MFDYPCTYTLYPFRLLLCINTCISCFICLWISNHIISFNQRKSLTLTNDMQEIHNRCGLFIFLSVWWELIFGNMTYPSRHFIIFNTKTGAAWIFNDYSKVENEILKRSTFLNWTRWKLLLYLDFWRSSDSVFVEDRKSVV